MRCGAPQIAAAENWRRAEASASSFLRQKLEKKAEKSGNMRMMVASLEAVRMYLAKVLQ